MHHASNDLATTGIGLLAIFITVFLVILALGGARMARARFSVFTHVTVRRLTAIAVLLVVIVFLGNEIVNQVTGFINENR